MGTTARARLIAQSDQGVRLCAAAARISTTPGGAHEIFDRSTGGEKDVRLIGKVQASGHRSLIEHHVLSFAFEDVSVLVEQFLIEFRLASFTVKSRRYVDFENAGYYIPDDWTDRQKSRYTAHMNALFQSYGTLVRLGIPKEDARFVLPYAFHSNFYVTANAREWAHIITEMRAGRGSYIREIRALGEELYVQYEAILPGVLDAEAARARSCAQSPRVPDIADSTVVRGCARLLGGGRDDRDVLRYLLDEIGIPDERALVHDDRPRALEFLHYAFQVRNVSLSCVTHFARHRMQSPIYPSSLTALQRGGYVLPETVRANDEARTVYTQAFQSNAQVARQLLHDGMPIENAAYLAMSGNTVDILFSMNARELLHFMKLRACARAQWEIRGLAEEMLALLRAEYPELFDLYGPSCFVDGRCPEGRLSCGNPKRASC